MTSIARFGACVAAAALIAGCGGSSNSSDTSSSTTSTTPTAMPAATTASQMSGGMPMAAVPADLKCTDAIVWVNTSKKTYHLSGDPFYGRTKHGEYMCQATADGKGYHLAGMPHRHTGSPATGGSAAPSPASTY